MRIQASSILCKFSIRNHYSILFGHFAPHTSISNPHIAILLRLSWSLHVPTSQPQGSLVFTSLSLVPHTRLRMRRNLHAFLHLSGSREAEKSCFRTSVKFLAAISLFLLLLPGTTEDFPKRLCLGCSPVHSLYGLPF